ncbi:MAG: 50S ribosomal protein L9 [Kiloniellaceae bacterium]
MQVILLERIEKLGQMGDIVTVKPGYARNYLLPRNKARRATEENLAEFERQRAQLEAENLKHREEADRVAGKLHGMTVTLIRQAGESGQLYGSVNTRDLGKAVSAAGVTIDRGQVVLDNVIKTLGLHRVKIRLHPEVIVTITANVARSETEAEAQAKAGHLVSAEEQRAVREAAAAAAISGLEQEAGSEAAAEEGDATDAAAPAGSGRKEDAKPA